MISSAWLALALLSWMASGGSVATAPSRIVVVTERGEWVVPVRSDPRVGPMLPAPELASALSGTQTHDGSWGEVRIAKFAFRFLLGAPWVTLNGTLRPIAAAAVVRRDTLFLPLQFVADLLPATLVGVYHYDTDGGRLTEIPGRLAAASPSSAPIAGVKGGESPASRGGEPGAGVVKRLPNGLRPGHLVAIDPGHGGVDPGNRGIALPRGVSEKDITLKVGLLVRDELERRGVGVRMTRVTDTLINLAHRAPKFCAADCDLFVSIHVNSLQPRRGYTNVRGFETFVLSEARTEDAKRVAQMENDAIRFEPPDEVAQISGLDFILKDLQINEHLRESVRAAELVQSHLLEVTSAPNRGVKHAPLMVLNTARRPAILVELGFATNAVDAKQMTTPAGQRHLAGAIADAIVAYLLEFERRVGDPAPPAPGLESSRP